MPKLSDLGDPNAPDLSMGGQDPGGNGRARELMLANLKSMLALPLMPAQIGQQVYYGATGRHAPAEHQINDMANIINNWAYQGIQPPQNKTEMAVGMAPVIATTPGAIGKVVQSVPIAIQGIKDNASQLMAGLAQAGAAEAGVPYVAQPTAAASSPTNASSFTNNNNQPPVALLTHPQDAASSQQGVSSQPRSSQQESTSLQADTPESKYKSTFSAPVEKPGSGRLVGSGGFRQPAAGYTSTFTAPAYQSQFGPPPITPYDKPSDVERTDASTGTAPYDDSKDWYARGAAILGGITALGMVAAGIKYAKGSRNTEGALSGRVTDSTAPVVPGAFDENKAFVDPDAGAYGSQWMSQKVGSTLGGPVDKVLSAVEGPVRGFVEQTTDRMAPLRGLLNKLPDGAQKDNLIGRVSLSDSHGIDLTTNNFYDTGRLPGSSIKLKEPPLGVFKDISNLSEADRKELNDLVTLNTRLDQSRADGYKPWGPKGGTRLSYTDMSAQQAAIAANRPDLLKLADRYHAMFEPIPKYAEQQGAIDASKRMAFEAANPYFAPQHRQYVEHWYDNLLSDKGASNKSSTDFLDFQKRMDIIHESLHPGEAGDLLHNAHDYFQQLFNAITHNKYRADVVDAFNGVALNGKPVFNVVKDLPRDPGVHAVPVYINGVKQYAIPQNYGVYSSLMFRPRTGYKMAAGINRAIQWTLTGPGNPLFPITKAITFDALHAPLMLPKGTDTSPLAAFPLTGILRGLWKDTAQASAHYFQESATNNTWLSQVMGPKNTETFAKLLQDVTERSTASLAERYGALGGSRYQVIGVGRSIPEALAQNIPEFRNFASAYSSTPGYNILHSILHASREGARLQFLASNLERQLVTRSYPFEFGQGVNKKTYNLKMLGWELPEDYDPTKLMGQARRLMGDSTEIGGDTTTAVGRANQKLMSATMFGNQTVQVTAQIARMIKDHPVRFAATASAMTYAAIHAYQMAFDDPSTRQMVKDMTPEQRGRLIPIKLPGWDQPMMLPVFQEMRPFVAGAVHMYLGMTGQLPKGEFETPWDAGKVAWNVTTRDYLPNFIGLLSPVMAMFGMKMPPNSFNATDAPSSQINETNDPDYQHSAEATIHNVLDTSTGPVIHAIGSAILGLHQTLAQNNAVKSKEFKLTPEDMARITAQQTLGPLRDDKTLGPLAPLWGIGSKMNVGNVTNEKVRDIRQALPQIIQRGADTVKAAGNRLQSGSTAPQGMSGIIPGDAGTPFASVYQGALQLDKTLRPMQTEYRALLNEEDKINTTPTYSEPKEKLTLLNELARKKADLNNQMLSATRAKEAELGKVIPGFTFDEWRKVLPQP